jgi:putative transposase
VTAYIDAHRGRFGVEPICSVLGVSASAYYHRKSGARSRRVVEDEQLVTVIRCVHQANYEAYGSRRMWKALRRAGHDIGRDRVARLMRELNIQGAKRRTRRWITTTPDRTQRRPDLVQRRFKAKRPDELWVADFTYLRSWQGLVFFSFVIDVYSRRVVGWQFASHMRTTLVLDAAHGALPAPPRSWCRARPSLGPRQPVPVF